MTYPVSILPKSGYKLIECNLDKHYLIRHTESSNIEELWDAELNCLKSVLVAKQSSQIVDISASLLSLFRGEYTAIELTDIGKGRYSMYCLPDELVDVPAFGEDFSFNADRCYWSLRIGSINGKKVQYKKGEDVLEAECVVVHTPMKWNVWHFSIRWNTHEGFIHEEPTALKKGWVRKLAHSAVVLIQENAVLAEVLEKSIDKACYSDQ